jgi:hypothetical protein
VTGKLLLFVRQVARGIWGGARLLGYVLQGTFDERILETQTRESQVAGTRCSKLTHRDRLLGFHCGPGYTCAFVLMQVQLDAGRASD